MLIAAAFLAATFAVGGAGAAVRQTGDAAVLGAVTGEPWTGAPGVRATTLQLMSAPATAPDESGLPEEAGEADREDLGQNAFAPLDAGHVTTPANGVSPAFAVSPAGTFLAAQLGADTTSLPPDSMGAVGPTQFLATLNGRIRVFDKNTFATGPLDLSSTAFFEPLAAGRATADPHVRYDPATSRWYIVMVTIAFPNKVLIAVSDGPVIGDTTTWTRFSFSPDQVGVTPNPDTGCFADFPTLGVDANALYIGTNMLCINAGTLAFKGTTGFVVRKSSVLSGGPIVVTAFRQLAVAGADGPYSPQGVDDPDGSSPNGYFIGVNNGALGELVLRRVTDPGGTPSISDNIMLTVPATQKPPGVAHLGGAHPLDSVDDRLGQATLRNGVLWTTHNVGVDSSGASPALPASADRTASRWYEIGALDSVFGPSLLSFGTIFDDASANPRQYFMPSVMVTGQGHAVLGMSTAGAPYRADAAVSTMLAGETAFSTPQPYTTSNAPYNPPNDALDRSRWGDYSATSLDPCDQQTVYTIQEWASATDTWGVQVAKASAPPPAHPVAATPNRIRAGVPSTHVLITGDSTAGSGFFDPGPGFACHLAAAVPGVTVSGVTYLDPTHLSFDVATVGAATGAKDVQVTNPDGQQVSETGLFTVDGTVPVIALATPSDGATYRQGANVVAGFACTDDAGAPPPSCTGTVADGAAIDTASLGQHAFTVHAVDAVGNAADQTVHYTVEDRTAPVITVLSPVEGAIFSQHQIVSSAYSCIDEPGGSGTRMCAGPVPPGTPIDTSTPGGHTFAVSGEDVAGNHAARTVHYTVNGPPVPPDLHVELSANQSTAPSVGGEVVYSVRVSTKGAGAASAVRLELTLPAGFAVARHSTERGGGCTGTAPRLTCDIGPVAPGLAETATITGAVGRPGELVATAAVTSLVEAELPSTLDDDTVTLRTPAAVTPAAVEAPPELRRTGGSSAPDRVAHVGAAAIVNTGFSVDGPVTLKITVVGPNGKALRLLAGSTINSAATGKARNQLVYGTQDAGDVQLRLRLPYRDLTRGRIYNVIVVATAASGETTRLVLPFRRQ